MKTLRDYFDMVLNKSFIDSDGRIYQIKSINNSVMGVVYDNGDETFLPSFLHYDDKRVSWFNRLRRPKDVPKGIKGEGPNGFIPSAQSQPKYTDPLEEHCCPDYTELNRIMEQTLKHIKGR